MYGSMVWHTHGIKVWIGGGMIKSLFKVEGQKYGMHSHGMVWYGMDRGWSYKETNVEGQKYGMAFSWYGIVWYAMDRGWSDKKA